MLRTNVVKTCWKVVTMKGYHRKDYLVWAESKETAKMQVPAEEEVVSVEKLDGEEAGET